MLLSEQPEATRRAYAREYGIPFNELGLELERYAVVRTAVNAKDTSGATNETADTVEVKERAPSVVVRERLQHFKGDQAAPTAPSKIGTVEGHPPGHPLYDGSMAGAPANKERPGARFDE